MLKEVGNGWIQCLSTLVEIIDLPVPSQIHKVHVYEDPFKMSNTISFTSFLIRDHLVNKEFSLLREILSYRP